MYCFFHSFRAGIGMGAAVIEFKLSQEISSIDQDLLFLVLRYLCKPYDTVY